MRFAGWQRGRRAVEEIARVRFAEVYTIIVPRVACEVLSVAVLKLYSPCSASTVYAYRHPLNNVHIWVEYIATAGASNREENQRFTSKSKPKCNPVYTMPTGSMSCVGVLSSLSKYLALHLT